MSQVGMVSTHEILYVVKYREEGIRKAHFDDFSDGLKFYRRRQDDGTLQFMTRRTTERVTRLTSSGLPAGFEQTRLRWTIHYVGMVTKTVKFGNHEAAEARVVTEINNGTFVSMTMAENRTVSLAEGDEEVA